MFTLEVPRSTGGWFTDGNDDPGPVTQLPCLAAFYLQEPRRKILATTCFYRDFMN